ncbi:type IV secretory system conjugative DNA transfer family protein [Rhizorhabdus sp.]|uniref:type IV secretory system conjugative DNA transfer family protein n=1 Tax=Rhizorhabdus sp. TaxID=1968843 RepID=UPI0025D402F2|nr:type IV secretory system conjugative DNA transfer family protein [Rhizorhabdus sp.]
MISRMASAISASLGKLRRGASDVAFLAVDGLLGSMVAEYDPEPERRKAQLWKWITIACMTLAALVGITLLWPARMFVDNVILGNWPMAAWWSQTASYYGGFFPYLGLREWWSGTVPVTASGWPARWAPFIYMLFIKFDGARYGLSPYLIVFVVPMALAAFVGRACPYELRPKSQGDAKWATEDELRNSELFAPTGMILGRVPVVGQVDSTRRSRGHSQRHFLRNWETLSGILISPPGTGKTVQLVTQILADWPDHLTRFLLGIIPIAKIRAAVPGPSMLINDPKGEIYNTTSRHRATLGPVVKLAWAETDPELDCWNPLDPSNYPYGLEGIALRRAILALLEPLYGPYRGAALGQLLLLTQLRHDWADMLAAGPAMLLSDDHGKELWDGLPHAGAPARDLVDLAVAGLRPHIDRLYKVYAEREKYLESLAAILIPETVEQHWRITGREALAGMMGFEIARAENDPVNYGEPSIPKILDWLNACTGGRGFRDPREEAVVEGSDGDAHGAGKYLGQDNVGSANEPTGGDADTDMTAQLLEAAIEEATRNGYPPRVINDLNALRMKPDRERGSVISTAGGAINIFKNAAVRARTSRSTFRITDLRGVPNGKKSGMKVDPISVYLVVPLKDANSLGRVTSLLLEAAAGILLSEDDEEVKRRKAAGTMRPVLLLIDEFWTLQRSDSLRQLPALGRGLWAMLLLVGQTDGQIASKYGSDGPNAVKELKASCHYKLYPAQNDMDSAKGVSELIGNQTVITRNRSEQKGFGKGVNPFSHNVNTSFAGVPLIRAEQLTRLQKLDPRKNQWGWQLVRFGEHNILCRPAAWFDMPELRKRAGKLAQPRPIVRLEEQQPATASAKPQADFAEVAAKANARLAASADRA